MSNKITAKMNKGKIQFENGTHFGFIKGDCKWAKVLEPGMYGAYEIDVYPNEDELDGYRKIAEKMCDETQEAVEGLKKKVENVNDFIKTDDDGKEYIKFKLPVTNYMGKEQKPVIIDKRGRVDNEWEELIGNGSEVKLKFYISAYYMAATKSVGVSAKFSHVQVIKLNTYSKEDTGFSDESGESDDLGFSSEEDTDNTNPEVELY